MAEIALSIAATGPIASWGDLRTQIALRMNRAEADITSPFDMWVSLAEKEIDRRLTLDPVRPQETISTATIDSEFYALPASFLEVQSLSIDGQDMKPTTAQGIAYKKSQSIMPAPPEFYAVVGNQIQVYPVPDQSYDMTLVWWSKIPPLCETNESNWVFESHVDVYWHGILAYGFQHFFDEPQSQVHVGYFDAALNSMIASYPVRPDRLGLESDIYPTRLSGWGYSIYGG